ncbi:uncharacterized protein DS421_13g405440 [Arachis hypogaea]|nr:uncharacterized protein DS421_13g405440 [Arachis hypogaea]
MGGAGAAFQLRGCHIGGGTHQLRRSQNGQCQDQRPRNGQLAGGANEVGGFVPSAHELGVLNGSSSKVTCIGCVWWQGTLGKGAKSCIKGGENLNRLDEHHIAAHLFLKPTRVLTPHGTLVDVFMLEPGDPTMEIRRERLDPYLRRTGFYHASLIKRFEYDNPLISAFVERWRPETHTFHLPWGECTITLEDVAMQLGLPIDGQPVSGTLRSWSKFHQRDIWEWCHELLGEVPPGHVGTTKYNIKLKWLRTRLQQMPLELDDNGLMQYARCYILYLLGGVLLPDKANNTVHVRYLPLLADFDAIGTYSWGSAVLCWLYVEGMAGCHTLLMSWIYYRLPFWAPNVTTPFSFPLATRYLLYASHLEKKGQNDYAEQRLLRHRLRLDNLQVDEFVWQPYMEPQILSRVPAEFFGHPHGDFYSAVVPLIFFRWIEILNIDRVLRQFGGKQGHPNPPLNIDTFHRQSSRNDDDTLRPSHDYYRWYCERTRRFLSAPDALHDPRGDAVPADAPAEYGRGPVVNLPPVPRDHRRRRPRRARVEGHADHGEDDQELPEQDRPSFEPDFGHHIPREAPPVAGDCYYPQPAGPTEPHHPFSIQQFMLYQNSYEIGGSSQGGTQDLIDSMDRVGWTNFSSLFDRLDHFIPQQSSPHTPTDLALALPRSDTFTQPAYAGMRSVSLGDTARSALRPYDAMQIPGRRLSYTGADATADEVEVPAAHPRRDTRAPSCGTGGRLGHEHR